MLTEGRRARRLRRLPDSRAAPPPPPRGTGAAVCVGAGVTCQPKAAAPCCVVIAVSALPADPPAGDAHGACMPEPKTLSPQCWTALAPAALAQLTLPAAGAHLAAAPHVASGRFAAVRRLLWGGGPSPAYSDLRHCCAVQSMRGGQLTGEGLGRRVPVLRAARRPASGGLCAACRGARGMQSLLCSSDAALIITIADEGPSLLISPC